MNLIRSFKSCFALLVIVFTCGSSISMAEVTFQGLGVGSRALGISADGTVVVGWDGRWTESTGWQSIGGWGQAASVDGSVVVGYDCSLGFRWTQEQGKVTLGALPGSTYSNAFGVSGDGSIVVGQSHSPSGYWEAFIWTEQEGMVAMPEAHGRRRWASAISSDGLVIVGSFGTGPVYGAFRWTESAGMESLGSLGSGFSTDAYAVSSDGSVIVGRSQNEAFRWITGGGMVGLGDLPGGFFKSEATAVSADGSIVVGFGDTSYNAYEAFIWDSESGLRNLREILETDFGLNLTGWTLEKATGISADGLTIVGYGTNPSGDSEAWITTIPEPATLLLLGLGGLMLLRKRKTSH